MKFLISMFLVFWLNGVQAQEGDYLALINGKNFATHAKWCGFHVESAGNTIYLESIGNIYYWERCNQAGRVVVGQCHTNRCTVTFNSEHGTPQKWFLTILTDGNIINENYWYFADQGQWVAEPLTKYHQVSGYSNSPFPPNFP